MIKAATKDTDLVVLFSRVHRHQLEQLQTLAKQSHVSVADLVRSIINQALSPNTAEMPQVISLLTSLERVLLDHTKQSLEDGKKITAIVTNIYEIQAKSTDNPELPEGIFLVQATKADKKGSFYCQSCGIETSSKRKHLIQVGEQQVKVGDCCYFNDRYKELVYKML